MCQSGELISKFTLVCLDYFKYDSSGPRSKLFKKFFSLKTWNNFIFNNGQIHLYFKTFL